MSFANNKTGEIWRRFMPQRSGIENRIEPNLYSVEIFGDTGFFNAFDPNQTFEKWAAIQVSEAGEIPEGMSILDIPEGHYAVFQYKGRASEAFDTYQYIFATWLPQSSYELDDRPHFALMGEKYRNDDPESEEELWIPVRN